ncbi:MAG: CooT family nickel-binding protein [Candidatus Subteraquimicrobiales bacterium]|nr:CooT family nickel-binding protein [Candidatus Subteraquimicrobiales bacterium]
MCEAKVFFEKEGKFEDFMDNVITVKPENDGLLLIDLFGEQKFVKAQVKEIKLLEHKVILIPKE